MTIQFGQSDTGLHIRDTIEHAEYPIRVDDGRTPRPERVSTSSFRAPVDAVAAVDAHTLQFPKLVNIYVRDPAGDVVAAANAGDNRMVPTGEYEVEVGAAPMKLYLRVDASIDVQHHPDRDQTAVAFDGRRSVRVGVRSHHEQPAGTITTTGEPRDLMEAVSTFGSALKTDSPERSFPTLRGHPPRLDLGDSHAIPDDLTAPDTGISIRVPPERASVFAVTPLAYYLGAAVEPAGDAVARIDLGPAGVTHRLTTPEDGYQPATAWTPSSEGDTAPAISEAANRVLSHLFTLDCAVRTEGLYEVDLSTQRDVLARAATWEPDGPLDHLPWREDTTPTTGGVSTHEETSSRRQQSPLDFAALYDMDLAERTAAYLELPWSRFSDVIDWPYGTALADLPENVRVLPETANRLSHVHAPPRSSSPPPELQASEGVVDAVDSFMRAPGAGDGDSERNSDRTTFPGGTTELILSPVGGYLGQLWAAEGVPAGSVKPSPVAHNRSLDQDPSESPIQIRVVCNDAEMDAEATDLYGFRELLSFDISVVHNRSCAELRRDLQSGYDLLHFIGHVHEDGIRCSDGRLNVHDVDGISADAFLLNGCRSYEQGAALVEQGSMGGFVTTEDVVNQTATRVGRTLADLLDAGFPLYGALDVLRSEIGVGSRYSVLGDPLVALSPASGVPTLHAIDRVEDGEVWATAVAYPTRQSGLGAMCSPAFGSAEMYLGSGPLETVRLSVEEAARALQRDRNPILVAGELIWTEDVELERVLRAADSGTSGSLADVLSGRPQ